MLSVRYLYNPQNTEVDDTHPATETRKGTTRYEIRILIILVIMIIIIVMITILLTIRDIWKGTDGVSTNGVAANCMYYYYYYY